MPATPGTIMQRRPFAAAERRVTGVLDTSLVGAHTLRAHRTSTRDWGDDSSTKPCEPARFRRRSGRLNRLRGEPSCGFTKAPPRPFGGSRKGGGNGTPEASGRNPAREPSRPAQKETP